MASVPKINMYTFIIISGFDINILDLQALLRLKFSVTGILIQLLLKLSKF